MPQPHVTTGKMTEPIIAPSPTDELEVLRRTNGEILAKSATRKARVAELEATVTELQSKLSEAHDSLHQVTIGGPLTTMAESISIAPDLWLERFSQTYKVAIVDGQLTMQTPDGKPVLKGEKPVPFEREALIDLLTTGDDARAKTFKAITITSKASGAATNQHGNRTAPAAEHPPIQFGLR
jgi:hypothetical protein